jgi:hypothetical protein
MHQDIEPTTLEKELRALGAEADLAATAPSEPTPESASPTPSENTPEPAPTPEPPNPSPNTSNPEPATPAAPDTFQREWWVNVRRELEATPELKDGRSELARSLEGVLRETPLYALAPDGFRQAVALARARQAASTLPALQAKLDAITRENERLIKLTSVTGSGPAKVAGDPGSDMNERDLRRLAAELDSI